MSHVPKPLRTFSLLLLFPLACMLGCQDSPTDTKAKGLPDDTTSEVGCMTKYPLKTPKTDCVDTVGYVCGCNGETYKNACEAKLAGVLKWEDGQCPSDTLVQEAALDTL